MPHLLRSPGSGAQVARRSAIQRDRVPSGIHRDMTGPVDLQLEEGEVTGCSSSGRSFGESARCEAVVVGPSGRARGRHGDQESWAKQLGEKPLHAAS
jgi:hypothetical protein